MDASAFGEGEFELPLGIHLPLSCAGGLEARARAHERNFYAWTSIGLDHFGCPIWNKLPTPKLSDCVLLRLGLQHEKAFPR